MHLAALTLHHLRLPLRHPWVTAAGTLTAADTLLLHAQASDGLAVWTESCPLGLPVFGPETAASAAAVLREHLAPCVLHQPLTDAATIPRLLAPVRGHHHAKAALELVWWALAATRQGVPLRRLFGGGDQPVPCGVGLGHYADRAALLAAIAAAFAAGAPRIKLKLVPGDELAMLRAVRTAFPHGAFMVDANGAYTRADLPLFQALDELGLQMIEQPLPPADWLGLALWQRALRTPLCLDESLTCRAAAELAIQLDAARIFNLKPGRVGGLGEALAIHALATAAGLPCWVGGMLESELGTALGVELATMTDGRYAHDLHPSRHWRDAILTEPPLRGTDAHHLAPADGPYLGLTVREDVVREYAVGRWEMA